MASASEIAAELVRQGVDASVAQQESGYLAATYGGIPAGAVQDYLKRSTNRVDNWDRPTASAGGIGGDIDLNGDGVVDRDWFLVDSADTGNPGWVKRSDLGKLSGDVAAFDVGGAAASDVVAAYFKAEGMYNNATEAARQEIDRLNLTGAFDDSHGQSAAGIAAARASIGKSLFGSQRTALGSLLGYERETIASSAPGAPVSGKRTLAPTTSTGGGTLLPPGPLRGQTPAAAAGGRTSTSSPIPSGPVRTSSSAPAGGGASPLVPIGLAVGALKLLGMF